jgi:hypothetical protein
VFDLRIPVSSDRLKLIKADLARILPDVKSSHRCEAMARGLGFNTYAAALSAGKSGTAGTAKVRGDRFIAYLAEHGFVVCPKAFYTAAAKIALRDVAERVPKLTVWGIEGGRPTRKPDGRLEDAREWGARFVEGRKELVDRAKPFLASLAFLDRVTRTKTIRNGTGSYWVKHIAENYCCSYPEGEELGPTCVPNGALIAAAIHAGFRIKTYEDYRGYDDINVSFNMSEGCLKDLDCEMRPHGPYQYRRRK